MNVVLECDGLHAGYNDVAVVRDFNLALAEGEILSLLGPNGAGKTTVLLTIAGLLEPLEGTISHGGERIGKSDPVAMARRGLTLVPDDRALFPSLTTREHLKLARGRSGMPDEELLDLFPGLKRRIDVDAGALSGGEQQMLALARALAQRPNVVIIDELSMGLAPIIIERLLPVLRRVADGGTAVMLVEQHVHLALEVADRAAILVHGEIILEGDAAELRHDRARLEHAYLTGSIT